MAKQLMINQMFSSINKDEIFASISQDVEALNADLEKEKALPKPTMPERGVGRLSKEVKLHLLKPKLEKPMKKVKVRGAYTNWFCPSLWCPIHVAMIFF